MNLQTLTPNQQRALLATPTGNFGSCYDKKGGIAGRHISFLINAGLVEGHFAGYRKTPLGVSASKKICADQKEKNTSIGERSYER